MDHVEVGVPDAVPASAPATNGNGRAAAVNGHGAGNGHVAAGNGHVAVGNGHVAAGNGHVAAGNGHVAAGNGHVTPRVSLVIAALNEARNIPLVFANIPPDVFEVILVDGNSTDGTIDVARAIRPDVRILGQPRPGKGSALISGFEASRGDIIVALDADGSTDAAEIARFVAALEAGADYVKGSRFIDGGGSADMTPLRSLGNRVLRTTVNALYGTRYTDLCYGYNAFWRRCLPQLALDCDGFEVETVMNIRAARARLRIAEVPSFEAERVHGESHLNVVRDGWRILRTIMRERRLARRQEQREPLSTAGQDAYNSASP